jgi:hypothetical protein
MRIAAIALFAAFLLIPATLPANACGGAKLTMAQAAATTELSADTTGDKKKVRKATKMKKEKVEYMRSAAPPEPKK